jgi:hypothetical protein
VLSFWYLTVLAIKNKIRTRSMRAWNGGVGMRVSERLGPTKDEAARHCLKHVTGALKRRAPLSLFLLLLAVFTGMPVDVARPTPQTPKRVSVKIESEIVGSVRLADHFQKASEEPLVWCFKEQPAFIYVSGQQVLRMTFGGALQEMMAFDQRLDAYSIQCSDDGSTITVLSSGGADLLVRKNEKVGRYKTAFRPGEPYRFVGQMLSPDGTMMASPFSLTLSSGDDVLTEMRVLNIAGESFSWRDNKVLYFDRAATSVRAYDTTMDQTTTLKQLGGSDSGRKYSVGEIVDCGKTDLVSVFWSRTDGSEKDTGNVVVSLNGDVQIKPDPGRYSWTTLTGRPGFGCILKRYRTTGGFEYKKWDLFLEDGLMNYVPPRGVVFESWLQVAPRDCLVLGYHYPNDKDGRINYSEESVVAIRITQAGHCGR